MAFKELQLPEIGTVRLYKRRGNRSLKLSVLNNGVIRVSLPIWVPYSSGLAFVKSKTDWIGNQRQHQQPLLQNNQLIGKAHHLFFLARSDQAGVTTRIKANEILVSHPVSMIHSSPTTQLAAQTAIRRALKTEADNLLPQRIKALASAHDFKYNSVSTRYLKSRWGSCNHKNDIVLNIYLMQLPWSLIDYVLLHELVHTKVLQHGPPFWREFEKQLPEAKKYRKAIRQYQPYAIL